MRSLALWALLAATLPAAAQPLAFPGAVGWAATTPALIDLSTQGQPTP